MLILHIFPSVLDIDCHKGQEKKEKWQRVLLVGNEVETITWGLSVFRSAEVSFLDRQRARCVLLPPPAAGSLCIALPAKSPGSYFHVYRRKASDTD